MTVNPDSALLENNMIKKNLFEFKKRIKSN